MDCYDQEALIRTSFDDDKNTGNLSPRGPRSRSPTPPWDQRPTISTPPKAIILGLWPHARDEQIKYYVQGYEALYPTAEILLLHHSRTSTKHIDGVLSTLISDEEKQVLHEAQQSHVLVHLFGDDAATHVCRLLRSYRLRTAHTLDVKSIILDSAPAIAAPNYKLLRRLPAQLLSFIWISLTSLFWTIVMTFRFSDSYNNLQVRQDLHDPSFLPVSAKKCYIFPHDDLMFAWDTSTHHDELCQRQDFRLRRNSIDHYTQRWTSDQERYWLGVENAWDGEMK